MIEAESIMKWNTEINEEYIYADLVMTRACRKLLYDLSYYLFCASLMLQCLFSVPSLYYLGAVSFN